MDAEQRRFLQENGYLVIKNAIQPSTVAAINQAFERQLREEKRAAGAPNALIWHLDRDHAYRRPDGSVAPRQLWHQDLVLPPPVAPVLRELCSSFDWGHLHPRCPPEHIGSFRLDLDGAHWVAPWDPDHAPNPATDLPEEARAYRESAGLPEPFSNGGATGGAGWTPDGILQGGLHGGPPLFHISCLYELQSVGPGDGGFGCLPGSHLPGARIGPQAEAVTNQHFAWGKPPFADELGVRRVEGQAGDCVLFTERLVHTTLPWVGRGERRSLFIKYVPYGEQGPLVVSLIVPRTFTNLSPRFRWCMGAWYCV